jgi:hypothetical protein
VILQEIIALVIVFLATLYLVERVFGVSERFGFRRNKKQSIKVGSRLERGLKKAKKR